MTEEAETLEIDTGHDDLKMNQVQQRCMQYLAQTAQIMMGFIANELKCEMPKASSTMLSVLSTMVMIWIRGYPRETWEMQLREVGKYFMAQADEAAAQKGEGNDGTSNSNTPAS